MVKFTDLLDAIDISPKLIYYVNNIYQRMSGQIRYSIGKLVPIKQQEVNMIFNIVGLQKEHFNDIIMEYPRDVFIMQQPIYNLLTLLVIKSYQLGYREFAYNVNNLMGMILISRIRYKFIRVVNQDLFEKTIANMNKKSYIGLHGQIWMLNTVCKQVHDRYITEMLKNPNKMYPRYRYIIDMRNRFNQIMKIIAKHYYYNYEHRFDIDPKVLLKNRTDDILKYILERSIPVNILEYISQVSGTSLEKLNELQHHIQIYASMQAQANLIIYNILERLLAYIHNYKEQFKKNVDINDIEFIRQLIVNLKRSTIILRSVDNEIFKKYGYERFDVLSFFTVAVIYVDSIKHPNDYYGEGSSPVADDNTSNTEMDYSQNYGNYNDDSDYFGESLMQLFDGIILDEEWGRS